METEYICQNCKKRFENPKTKDGMIVCPSFGRPDFETITYK